MAVLVVAEHDNKAVKPATLNAVAAAAELGSTSTTRAAASAIWRP
jgi:hypothetical protein